MGPAQRAHWDSGYSQQQATRPQTLADGLSDLPVGQAAWILEKFWAWTDPGDDPLALDHDALLDNMMLYWLTNSAASRCAGFLRPLRQA